VQGDWPSIEQELPVQRAHQGHGIGDQHQSVATLAAKGDTQACRIDVMPSQMIPANSLLSSRRRAHQPRLPPAQLRHGIEQMVRQ
jgi:hypothetical protein